MSADKRNLRRIDNKFGVELYASVTLDGMIIKGTVINYNSLSALIQIDPKYYQYIGSKKILCLQLFYGSQKTCEVKNPKVVRMNNLQFQIIFNLTSENVTKVDREERVELGFDMQGIVTGIDPFTLDQVLTFRMFNISKNGFALLSSKSNRHLTPGLRLENFKILLPGHDAALVSFLITNVVSTDMHLKIGCRFENVSEKFLKEIDKIAFTNSNIELPDGAIDKSLKSKIKRIKNFDSKIRVRRITTDQEYNQALKIRYKSYKEANKVKVDQDWQDMADEYDDRSIIYIAYVGRTIAGTIRLVFRSAHRKLPFESQIPLEEVKNFDASSSAEVSRFAIDPHFQGTDLFFAMFRKIIFEIGAKQIRSPVCLATKKLSKYYKGIGAIEISKSIPHPTIPDETLTLFLFDPDNVIEGNMSALGWFFIAKPSLRLLRKFNFVRKPSLGIGKYFRLVFEVIGMSVLKIIKKSPSPKNLKISLKNETNKSA